jgi:hypothetical protein
MLEEQPVGEEKAQESRPLTATEKKILYAAAVIVLCAASFLGGRYSAHKSAAAPDPFARDAAAVSQPLSGPTSITAMSLNMIDFTGASPVTIDMVLTAYNLKKCGCGCAMSMAECIAKDPNCPMWKDHILEFQKALGNGKKPDLSKMGNPAITMPGNMPQMPKFDTVKPMRAPSSK